MVAEAPEAPPTLLHLCTVELCSLLSSDPQLVVPLASTLDACLPSAAKAALLAALRRARPSAEAADAAVSALAGDAHQGALDLSGLPMTDAACVRLASCGRLRTLRHLCVQRCAGVTSEGLVTLLRAAPQLSVLRVGCAAFSEVLTPSHVR